jgi:ABC-type multidrug transport system fused ATPase/permease subunit
MGIFLRKLWAFLVAFMVFGLLLVCFRFIGTLLTAITIDTLGAEAVAGNTFKTIESLGNIFMLFVVAYPSFKVYKKFAKQRDVLD